MIATLGALARETMTMAQFDRHYTIEEAQERIPWVRKVFGVIHALLEVVENPQTAEAFLGGNPGVDIDSDTQITANFPIGELPTLPTIRALTGDERRRLMRGLLHGLMREGIVVQDLRRGLIDFPSWARSREVLLCYELLDGDRIGHWHEVDAGFAGRRPLTNIED